jgi:WXXGXW repeat (2 copies)
VKSLIALCLIVASSGWSHPVGERGLVHEALVTRSDQTGMLRSFSEQPPAQVNEVSPPQPAGGLVWIQGYWAWGSDISDWVWVSGIWRNPPPGRGWIRGFWRELNEGWVWIPGFWSDRPIDEVQFIAATPPDSVEEEVPSPPGDDFFWMPGYWEYGDDYVWLGGGWERLDSNWVLTPARYTWRPGGFIFVDSYWDWPLEARGVAYENAPSNIGSESFEPAIVLDGEAVVERLFCCYPDCNAFFQHHFFFHPDFWSRWCCTPPWWNWNSWWSFTWSNSWALWWWWSHPGYPQPPWITEELASQISPPNQETIFWMKRAQPPPVVTSRGVARPGALARAMELLTHRGVPVLPARPRRIIDRVERTLPKPAHVLRPTGNNEVVSPVARPQMVPGTLGEPPETGRVASLPKKPNAGQQVKKRAARRPQNFERFPGQRRPRTPGSRQRPWLRSRT